MSRLGMLYALTEEEAAQLRAQPQEQRYDYMLEEIEEKLFGTERACELDKAWEGIQYCLGGGRWTDSKQVPSSIIFGGEFWVNTDSEVLTLKDQATVEKIVAYLHKHNLQELIRQNFWKIEDENFLYKDENGLEHCLGWSEDVLPFYENALKEHCVVIFTVDF